MKRLTAEETAIITSTDTTMAAIMTSMRFARPMAVNTESSEKTMSMIPICTMISQKPRSTSRLAPGAAPLQHGADLCDALHDEKTPPREQHDVAHRDLGSPRE